MAQIIQTIFQFKRGDAERWNELNPILAEGEPGFELDTNKFKIGNGINTWKELPYKGEANIVNAQTRNDFPAYGNENAIYKAQDEKLLYQWNPDTSEYEVLGAFGETDNGDPITIDIELSTSSMNPVANKVITMALQDFAEAHYTKQEVDTAIENTNKRIDLLEGTTHFRGIYPNLNDETLNADLYEFSAGDIFIVENAEYICTTSGNLILLEKANYEKLGDVSAEIERISVLEEKVGNEKNGEIEATGLYQAIAGLENTKLDKTALNNYYSKDETYATTEIDSLLQEIDNREEVTTLRELVDTIIGDDVGLSMRTVAVAVVAEIIGKAPEAFDTLEEIAAWIEAHPGDVAAIIKRISDLETSVSTKVDKTDIINTLDSTALDKPLSAAMGKELNSLIEELSTNINDAYVKQTELNDAVNTALETAKESGEFDGQDGGHYTPSVKDNGNGTMTVTFTASKSDMSDVNPITISLPIPNNGKDGDDGEDGGYYIPSVNTISNNKFKISFTASKSGMPAIGDVTIILPTAEDGDDGVGISSVVQTTTSSEDGGENIITVTLTNGNKSTFKVKNGSKGSKGDAGNGIKSIVKTSTSGLVDTYTITLTNNTTATFTVTNGTSVTVSSVTESAESGGSNVVEFSDGKSLTVKNGKDGKDGVGVKGEDGYTPVAGVDYPTDAQFDEKIATALAERNQLEPLIAESIDWLNENGDPTKVYIIPNPDGQGGKVYAHTEKTITTEPEAPVDINMVDEAGVIEGYRLSSDGSTGTPATINQYMLTVDYIPCDDDDVLTVTGWRGKKGVTTQLVAYDSNKTKLANRAIAAVEGGTNNIFSSAGNKSWATYSAADDTFVSKPLTAVMSSDTTTITGIAYIRLSAVIDVKDTLEIYINKGASSNEPSVEIVSEWYALTDFIPTNDARIDELNRAIQVLDAENISLGQRVSALESGIEESGAIKVSRLQALENIRNWDKPFYEQLTPFLLDKDLTVDTTYPKTYYDTNDADGALRRVNVQKVYDEYNALCTAHPDFVRDITDVEHGLLGATETTFGGLCSDGIQYVRVYEFCEREGRHSNTVNANNWSETKPTFVIITGIHWEYNGVYSMLYALKEITENPKLRDMRRNCRFIVIPMSNPYTFTTYNNSGGGHYNANGVEIHNNFEVEFNNAIDSTHGTAPLTEVETRYIDNAIRRFKDTAVCLLSCHSCASPGANFIWGSTATKFMCNVSMRLVDMMSNAWDVKYDGTDGNYNYRELIDQNKSNGNHPQDDGDYRCGFASLSTSSGTEAKQATLYGVQGINVEVFEWFYPFDPSATNKLLAYSRGAEVYVNLLRLLAATYDHNDRDKYAPKPAYEIQE